jgi:hypothetical protein
MSSEPTATSPRKTWFGVAAGTTAGAVFALGLYLAALRLQPDSGLILISVLLIPPAASALAVLVAGIYGPGSGAKALVMAVWVVTILMLCSAIFLREGIICLAMAAPIFYPLGIIGALLATFLRSVFGKRTPPTMVVLLPLLLMPFERPDVYPTMHPSVVTQIEIEAPIETVWREAVEIRDIAESEQSWTVTQDLLRVPRPVDAQLVRRNGQLVRAAAWRGGIRFYEIVTEWRLHRSIAWTFDIPASAADRLLDHHLRLDEDYLRLQGGRYDFEALSPTRTRLTLTTHYMARTPFNAYARTWGELLLGDIHRNVLQVVRQRAERDTPLRDDRAGVNDAYADT